MATTQTPYGLRVSKSLGQRRQGHGFKLYPIASGYAANLLTGDLVKLIPGGTIEKETGTATALPIGVFIGVSYTDAAMGYLNKQQWVSGTVASDAMAYVVEDPDTVFQIQANGTLSRNAVGTNAAIVQGAGNVTLGRSGVSLNAGSIAGTATLPLRIVEMVNKTGFSVPGDAYTDVLVKINTHALRTAAGNAAA